MHCQAVYLFFMSWVVHFSLAGVCGQKISYSSWSFYRSLSPGEWVEEGVGCFTGDQTLVGCWCTSNNSIYNIPYTKIDPTGVSGNTPGRTSCECVWYNPGPASAANEAVTNFTLQLACLVPVSQGPQGVPGPQGIPGPQGTPGTPGEPGECICNDGGGPPFGGEPNGNDEESHAISTHFLEQQHMWKPAISSNGTFLEQQKVWKFLS